MKPSEKALELVKKFSPHVQGWDCYHDCPRDEEDILKDASKCALIAVDEIIKVVFEIEHSATDWKHYYWREVKQEIEKL